MHRAAEPPGPEARLVTDGCAVTTTWAAVPVDTGSADPTACCADPCEVAGTELAVPATTTPALLINTEHVTAAASLATIYQYGDRLGFFAAVGNAIQQLGNDELCVTDSTLLNLLNC